MHPKKVFNFWGAYQLSKYFDAVKERLAIGYVAAVVSFFYVIIISVCL